MKKKSLKSPYNIRSYVFLWQSNSVQCCVYNGKWNLKAVHFFIGFFFVQCLWCLSSFLSVAYRVWQYEHTNTPTKLCSLRKWSAKPASAPVHSLSQCLQKMWRSGFLGHVNVKCLSLSWTLVKALKQVGHPNFESSLCFETWMAKLLGVTVIELQIAQLNSDAWTPWHDFAAHSVKRKNNHSCWLHNNELYPGVLFYSAG